MPTRPPHRFTLPVLLACVMLAGMTWLPASPAAAQAPVRLLHLPLVQSAPIEPLLLEVDNPDGNGDYTLAWVEQIPGALVSYELQEAADPAFTSLVREVCPSD